MKIKNKQKLIFHIALFVVFFSPAFAYLTITFNSGNTLLFEDGLLQSFPFRFFIHNAFKQDFSPQWVPYSGYGFSLLAEGQSGICFPATQIIYFLFNHILRTDYSGDCHASQISDSHSCLRNIGNNEPLLFMITENAMLLKSAILRFIFLPRQLF